MAGFRVDSPWISLRERVEALWKNLRLSYRSPTLIHRLSTRNPATMVAAIYPHIFLKSRFFPFRFLTSTHAIIM
uniref:Uncharacterized protein n=1 Tax=Candidatus Kentrum sp. SD TaxID=2126332 RepID=A0A450Z726_9GAMM|nr:MAG: hypothetical protein BECKSD772E_GA0070983_11943 [Candidatus Kentron sp. SD]